MVTTVIDTARIITIACAIRLAITGDVTRRYAPRERLISPDTHDSPAGRTSLGISHEASMAIGDAATGGAPTRISIPAGTTSAAGCQSSGRSGSTFATSCSTSGATGSRITPVA